MTCEPFVQAIDSLFLGELSSRGYEKLLKHLHGCPRCARYYDRLMLAARAMAGSDAPSPEELAPLGPLLSRDHRTVPLKEWFVRVFAGAVAVGCAVFAVLTFERPAGDAGQVEARGSASVQPLTLRAYCLSEGPEGRLAVVEASSAEGPLRCSTRHLLQFGYTLRAARPSYLFVAARGEGEEIHQYQPRPPAEGGLELAPTEREAVLPGSVRLGVNHAPGPYTVFGLVTEEPLSRAEALERLRRAGSEDTPGVVRLTLQVQP